MTTEKSLGIVLRRGREWQVLWDAPEGYPDVEYTDELELRDVYDEQNITYDFENENLILASLIGKQQVLIWDPTWQEVRDVRDQELHDTDAKVGQTDALMLSQDGWLSI